MAPLGTPSALPFQIRGPESELYSYKATYCTYIIFGVPQKPTSHHKDLITHLSK